MPVITAVSLGFAGFLAGITVGIILATSFLVAPIIFQVLDDQKSREFTRIMWPRYFLVILFLSGLCGGLMIGQGPIPFWISGLAFGSAIFMAINYILARLMRHYGDREKQGDEEAEKILNRMHSVTVWLNWASLAAMTWVFLFLLSV